MINRSPSFILLFLFLLAAIQSYAVSPIVTVRFSNPVYTCATQTYKLDVEFQCDSANQQLNGMNVRFYYEDNVLEFLSYGEFKSGYSAASPNPPWVETDTNGYELFTFDGPWKYSNGAIKKATATPITYLPTSGWVKLFCVNFHVDDPAVISDTNFCPSVVWDLKENPADGGIRGGAGVVITLVKTYPNITKPATEHVIQYNWQYDSIPGLPHGFPVDITCMSTQSSFAPATNLPVLGFSSPGSIDVPVTVSNFHNITSLKLVFEYDPAIMTYSSCTPNSVFTTGNGLLNVSDSVSTNGKRKIKMNFTGVAAISLADNSHLVDLFFNYISGTSDLTWKTGASTCFYKGIGNVLKCDQPYSSFYLNGSVNTLLAPVTKIDSAVAVEGNYVTFSVRVWDFLNILSGNLTLNYDSSVLVFEEGIPHYAIATSFTANVITPGTLELSWTNRDTTLNDESILVYLTFQYLGSTTNLNWYDVVDTACQYISSHLLQPLTDNPNENFYLNGSVANATYVWTGQNSGDWNSGTNWSGNNPPDQYTDVIIDASTDPNNWPTYSGNFTLGVNCRNLILNGNARFTVNGDLTINPGHHLDLGSSGILQVSGDWNNTGIFNPGSGTVEFTGTSNAIITEGTPPGNYVANYQLAPFAAGMVPITGGTAGPSGNDAHSDVNIGFNFNYLGTNYSQVRINTNGWLSFNLTGNDATSSDNTILFNTSAPTKVLAPWWDDLDADATSAITYKTEGSSPSRIFTVEWNNILAYSSSATARLNFQVKLYETSGNIEFCYGSVTTGTHNDSEGASIGIKDATGGAGNYIEATQNSTEIVLAGLKSNSDWPAVNYRFSPPVENSMEIFHKILISKSGGQLQIQRDVKVTGLN